MPVHGIDNGNNKHEVYTTEELLSILQQAINSGSLQGIDPTQTPIVAAVRESHNNSDVTFWSGTEAEFNELTGVTSELIGARIGSDGKLYLLSGDTTLSDTIQACYDAALEATEGMKREVISVTLTAAGWSNTAPYTQTVAVAGMTADKDFLAPYLEPTGNESDDLAAQVALSCISGGTTDTDSVTFYCYDEKPTTTITVFMVDKGTKIEPDDHPIASPTNIGMVKVGDGLNVDQLGKLSVKGFGLSGYFFDTVAEMKDYDLAVGDVAETRGYYTANDGGGATYVIRESSSRLYEELSNNLVAELVIPANDTINIRQLGAKSFEDNGNALFDCHDYIERFVNAKAFIGRTLTLYIPSGRWATSPLLITESSLKLIGNESFLDNESLSSCITPYEDNQSYVIKFGGFGDFTVATTNATRDITVKNIAFTARYSSDTREWYHVENGLLCLDYCLYSFFDNIFFQKFDGQGLYMRSCWEIYFGTVNFRTKTNPAYPCILLDDIGAFISGANLSALDFNNLMFEGVDGTMIKSKENSSFTHSNFNNINIEYTTGTTDSHRQVMTSGESVTSYHEMAMFDGKAEYVTFNNINFYMQNDYKLVFDEDTYYLSALFRNAQDNLTGATLFIQNIAVNTIFFKTFAECHTKVALSRNANAASSGIAIGNLIYPPRAPINLFNFENGAKIHVSNMVNGDQPRNNFVPFLECATFYNNRGILTSDNSAGNNYKLVYKKPSVGINDQNMNTEDGKFVYPFNNTDTVKLRVNLKADAGTSYKLIIRGTLNGASKDYNIQGTGTGSYVLEEKEIAFDANTEVKFVESLSLANCYIDWFALN